MQAGVAPSPWAALLPEPDVDVTGPPPEPSKLPLADPPLDPLEPLEDPLVDPFALPDDALDPVDPPESSEGAEAAEPSWAAPAPSSPTLPPQAKKATTMAAMPANVVRRLLMASLSALASLHWPRYTIARRAPRAPRLDIVQPVGWRFPVFALGSVLEFSQHDRTSSQRPHLQLGALRASMILSSRGPTSLRRALPNIRRTLTERLRRSDTGHAAAAVGVTRARSTALTDPLAKRPARTIRILPAVHRVIPSRVTYSWMDAVSNTRCQIGRLLHRDRIQFRFPFNNGGRWKPCRRRCFFYGLWRTELGSLPAIGGFARATDGQGRSRHGRGRGCRRRRCWGRRRSQRDPCRRTWQQIRFRRALTTGTHHE